MQIVIGLCMMLFGARMADARATKVDRGPQESVSITQAFTGGAVLTIVGLPGAVPLFAAIDQVLRADPPAQAKIILMVYYTGVFILPLFSVVVIRLIAGEKCVPFLEHLNVVVTRWARRLIIVLLVVGGLVLFADGVGWLFGHPLLPIP